MSKDDTFLRLKYMGYCLSNLPPEGVTFTFEDFVNYCKFQLCKLNNKLMLDPVWNNYENEEIIVEYYAHVYSSSKEERAKLETALTGHDGSIYDWFDSMIEKNKQELNKKVSDLPEDLSFTPSTLGE